MTDLQKHLYEQVLADHDYVVGLRRDFHRHPELGKEEFETAAAIERELDKIGVAHRRVAVTGVCAGSCGMIPLSLTGMPCMSVMNLEQKSAGIWISTGC